MYELPILFSKARIKIRRCPRCRGPLLWPHLTHEEKEFFVDKIKCFSCGRVFRLSPNGGDTAVWRQWPDRNEEYDEVHETI